MLFHCTIGYRTGAFPTALLGLFTAGTGATYNAQTRVIVPGQASDGVQYTQELYDIMHQHGCADPPATRTRKHAHAHTHTCSHRRHSLHHTHTYTHARAHTENGEMETALFSPPPAALQWVGVLVLVLWLWLWRARYDTKDAQTGHRFEVGAFQQPRNAPRVVVPPICFLWCAARAIHPRGAHRL